MTFFNSESGTLGPLMGWMGQIVDESTWLDNTANSEFKHKLHTSSDIAGYGYRYKVRIFGRDTEVKNFSDDLLEMAEVLLPVTAGSGHGGSVQTPNLKQGAYVWGFYKDGIDATEPVIFGVLPNNAQTSLFGGNPDKNFVPRSGYLGNKRPIPVSTKNIKVEGLGSPPCAEGINSNKCDVRSVDTKEDAERSFFIPKTVNCEGPSGELDGIQKNIKNLLIGVKRAKRASQSFLGAASDLNSNITNLVNEVSGFIGGLLKSLITKIRSYVVNWLNKETKKLFDLLPPNLRPELADGVERGTNTIQCVFNKIISKLISILKKLLNSLIDRYINAPLCAIESFIGSFISTVLGELTSGINAVVSSILGTVSEVSGLIFQAMDVLIGVLNFLSCEEDLDCQILDEWSFLNGSKIKTEKFSGELGKNLKKFVDETNNSAPACNTNQVPCGPPIVQFFGSGSGASGNVIVSATGYILGVDLISGGTYRSDPDVVIVDNCGLGNGAIAVATTRRKNNNLGNNGDNNDGEEELFEVDNVIITDPGFGYLNSENGSTGGDGVLFSRPDETIVNTDVFPPNTLVQVKPGDIIFLPSNSTVEVFDSTGNVVEVLSGQGQTTPIIITENGVITTPDTQTESPNIIVDTYKTLVCIEDLAILNEGVNYSSEDKIIITPSNGVEVEPILDEFGKIVEVNVISKGCGFNDVPEITIETTTGINAVLVPVFSFRPVTGTSSDDTTQPDLDTKVINVVDCVGKFKR
jgi:hypothetical protein